MVMIYNCDELECWPITFCEFFFWCKLRREEVMREKFNKFELGSKMWMWKLPSQDAMRSSKSWRNWSPYFEISCVLIRGKRSSLFEAHVMLFFQILYGTLFEHFGTPGKRVFVIGISSYTKIKKTFINSIVLRSKEVTSQICSRKIFNFSVKTGTCFVQQDHKDVVFPEIKLIELQVSDGRIDISLPKTRSRFLVGRLTNFHMYVSYCFIYRNRVFNSLLLRIFLPYFHFRSSKLMHCHFRIHSNTGACIYIYVYI